MSDCIFCKIVDGEVPCERIYEDEETLAFLDMNPASKGHTLVIPKKHYKQFIDVPGEELAQFVQSLKKVSKAISLYAEGFNIIQNNGKVSGQLVPHVHFHIIPRWKEDGIVIGNWKRAAVEDTKKVQEEIKALF